MTSNIAAEELQLSLRPRRHGATSNNRRYQFLEDHGDDNAWKNGKIPNFEGRRAPAVEKRGDGPCDVGRSG